MKHYFTLLVLFILVLAGCTDNQNSTENSTDITLFTASIDTDYLLEGQQGWIVLSDMQGNVLQWQVYQNGSQVIFTGESRNDNIQITNIKGYPQDLSVSLYTRSDIKECKNWTFRRSPDYPGGESVSLNFINQPQHSGYLLSLTGRYFFDAEQQIQSNQPYSTELKTPQDNLFVLLKNTRSTQFKWITGIESGSYDIDLSQMNNCPTATVIVPQVGSDVTTNLKGYCVANQHNLGYHRIGNSLNYNATNHLIDVYTPNSFEDYNFSVTISEIVNENLDLYYYSYYGTEIPSEVPLQEAQVEIDSLGNDFLWFSTEGNFDIAYSHWHESNNSAFDISWYYYSSNQLNNHQPIDIPLELETELGGINTHEIVLNFISLCSYDNLHNYEDICDTIHSSNSYFNEEVNLFLVRSLFPNLYSEREQTSDLLSPDEYQ